LVLLIHRPACRRVGQETITLQKKNLFLMSLVSEGYLGEEGVRGIRVMSLHSKVKRVLRVSLTNKRTLF
jgi:hypothetical protein